MKYFYDTEFVDDGSTVDMISIGIVAEDGRTYYAQSMEFSWFKAQSIPWIKENVLSKLDPAGDPSWKTRDVIAAEVYKFLTFDKDPVLWAWFASYDHIVLSQLFGRMIDLPSPLPMFTNDLRSLIDVLGVYRLPAIPAGDEHNALTDALLLRMRYDYVVENNKVRGLRL